jgi:hypothetical protein
MPKKTCFVLAALMLARSLDGAEKQKGPSLSLRAAPRVAAAPVSVLFTAEVQGGADADVYCPTLEWEWGDGSKGSAGGDCPPYVAGETEVQRLFEAEHEYRQKGQPTVTLRITKDGKPLAVTRVDLRISPPYKRSLELEQR